MPPRRQPSSIDRLPPEIRDSIAGLRRQGRTIDEIMQHLAALDVDVSRSALGRHVKSLAEIGEEMRRSETMARFVVEQFGEDADDRVGRANMRILQGALLELITARREGEDGELVSLSAEEAKSISLSLQRLVSAQRMDTDRQLKLRAQVAKEAATAVEEVAKAEGLSAATVLALKTRVLGVAA